MQVTDTPEHPNTGVRLAKHLAEQLQCSRREAELLIENGDVQVDGQTVETLGARVLPTQTVTVRPGAKPQEVPPVTLLLHKPAGYTVGPARGKQRSALDLLKPECRAEIDTPAPIKVLSKHFTHLETVLTIPVPASGLVVFTQDHRVLRKLREDALHIEQECIALVEGALAEGGLERLCDGTAIPGKKLPRCKVSWQSEGRLRFALKGIFPEEIEAMCAGVGLTLVGLKRLRVGRISMAKLPEGQWRYAMPWERF